MLICIVVIGNPRVYKALKDEMRSIIHSELLRILVTQGIDIVTISKMLGHARVSTTEDIYTHVIEASKELASNELANIYYRN